MSRERPLECSRPADVPAQQKEVGASVRHPRPDSQSQGICSFPSKFFDSGTVECRPNLFSQFVSFDLQRSRSRKIFCPNNVARDPFEIRQASVSCYYFVLQ